MFFFRDAIFEILRNDGYIKCGLCPYYIFRAYVEVFHFSEILISVAGVRVWLGDAYDCIHYRDCRNDIAGMEMQYPDCIDGPELLTMNLVCNTSAFLVGRVKATIAAMNITEKLVNTVEHLDFPQFYRMMLTYQQ